MTARPAARPASQVKRPAIQRHRAGKVTGASSSDEDEDGEKDNGNDQRDASKARRVSQKPTNSRTIPAPPKVISAGKIISSNTSLAKALRPASTATATAAAPPAAVDEDEFITEEESGDSDDEEEDEDDDEEEDEEGSSSEDEPPRRKLMMRPKFIPKSQRNTSNSNSNNSKNDNNGHGKSHSTHGSATVKSVDENDETKAHLKNQAETDALIEAQIHARQQEAAEKRRNAHWEDNNIQGDYAESDVDTADDVDPVAEQAAWKARELRRIKRDRDALVAREAEIAERERRRNLTEEERAVEDAARVAAQEEEKGGADAGGKYLARYHHKGAFFLDDENAQRLAKRDVMGARFEDETDLSLLPKALQIRDQTRIGKKGAQKHVDLRATDTGQWGQAVASTYQKRSFGGQRTGGEGGGGVVGWRGDGRGRDVDRDGPGGANAIPLGERRRGGAGSGNSDGSGFEGRDKRKRDMG